MVDSTAPSVCRLTLMAPKSRLDVAVPVNVALADVAATLLHLAGEDVRDKGVENGGWVLSGPYGEMDMSLSPSGLGLRDGDPIFLTPSDSAPPFQVYDDVIELVADAAKRSSPDWLPWMSRLAALIVAGLAAVATSLLILTVVGHPVAAAGIALGAATALEISALLVARVMADGQAGGVLGAAGLPLAFAGGVRLIDHSHLEPAALLVAGASVLVFSVLGMLGAGAYLHVFVAAVVASIGLMTGALFTMSGLVSASGGAAVAAVLAVTATSAAPLAAVRLSRVPVPPIPATPEDLRTDEAGVDPVRVTVQVRELSRYLEGLLTGAALTVLGCVGVLVRHGGVSGLALAGALSITLLMRARTFVRLPQRLTLMVSGVAASAVTGTGLAYRFPTPVALGVLSAALAVILTGCVGYAIGLGVGTARPAIANPVRGRLLDILDILVLFSLLPLLLAVCGAFTSVVNAVSG